MSSALDRLTTSIIIISSERMSFRRAVLILLVKLRDLGSMSKTTEAVLVPHGGAKPH